MKNYYEILEVHPKASREVIEKAYRVLVKKNHPDLYSQDKGEDVEEKIKSINEAYKVLSDEFLREQYDKELKREEENKRLESRTNTNARTLKQTRKKYIRRNSNNENEESKESKTHEVGSLFSLIDLFGMIFRKRNAKIEKRELVREDWIAAGITLVIVLVIGIILWFVPFTNGFIRSLIPF